MKRFVVGFKAAMVVGALMQLAALFLAGCTAPKTVTHIRPLPYPSLGATDGVLQSYK